MYIFVHGYKINRWDELLTKFLLMEENGLEPKNNM